MNQITASRPWESSTLDLASTEEVPQVQDWLLDDVQTGDDEADCASDTIPSPPPDSDDDPVRVTIPAPPPIAEMESSEH